MPDSASPHASNVWLVKDIMTSNAEVMRSDRGLLAIAA